MTIDPTTVTDTEGDRYFGIQDDIPEVDPTDQGKGGLLGGSPETLQGQIDFVNGLYVDVLGRAADVNGVNYWVGLLQVGFARTQVATDFWESPEHRALQVDALYQSLLHRSDNAQEQGYWVAQLLGGQSEEQVSADILASPEYALTHATAASFVDGLYADVLTRAPDSAGEAFWEAMLQNGASREQVALGLLDSAEAVSLRVARDYAAYLRRPVDPAGLDFWVPAAQNSAKPTETTAVGVLSSDEYFLTVAALIKPAP